MAGLVLAGVRQALWRTAGESMYCVYILRSLKNHKRYVGYTSKSPQERLAEHNAGTNQFTKGNRPYKLIHHEFHKNEDFAKKRERFFKSGNGRKVLDQILKKYVPVAQLDRASAFKKEPL